MERDAAAGQGITQSSLSRFLDGDFWGMKNELRRQIAGSPLFQQRYDLTLDEIRSLTVERVKFAMGLPQVQRAFQEMIDKKKNFINRSLIIGEVLCTADMTTGVKCGVICWLFGGAVMNLGSPEHIQKWFLPLKCQRGTQRIAEQCVANPSGVQMVKWTCLLEVRWEVAACGSSVVVEYRLLISLTCAVRKKGQAFTGMFAMTERGHGSNVRGILTEAVFDPDSQEFVIHTPCENAEKMYIGNATKGNYAAVLAQLIIHGKSQGPHCFIVPIRDQNGKMYPGVGAVDMMHKEGLHGVDNGILTFNQVRIPRENLLDKFGSVSPDGKYHSSIENKSARFNAMLAALTPTRLALTFQALGAMKLGLTIAIRYSHSRRQFGPKGKEEVKIIEHQTQHLRLMPHLATALALTFTSRYAGEILDEDVYHNRDLVNNRPLQALVAGLKAYSTWENLTCLQDCRECTGGMGFMMENRIPGLKCDSDVFVTFEGDNVVMLQVVVRELLAQYTRQYEESPVFGLLRNWSSSVGDRLRTSFLAFNTDKISSLTFLLKAVNFRERVLQRGLAARLYRKVMTQKEEFFSAWNSCLHHVVTLALAHIHRVTLEQFTLAVEMCPVPEDQSILMEFCLLYGTKLVYQERAWYLEHKYLTPATSSKIRNQLLELCRLVKDEALKVVSAFNIPYTTIQAPIAGIPNPRAKWAYYPQPQEEATGDNRMPTRISSKL